MIQARVTGHREGCEGKSELSHAPQALHRARLEQRFHRPVYRDVPPDNVPDSSLLEPPKSSPTVPLNDAPDLLPQAILTKM